MKIARLRKQADALAQDAHSSRLRYRRHVSRSLSILRRRVGSTAGLAISFSLGFMAGTGTTGSTDDSAPAPRRPPGRGERGVVHQVAHGPLGAGAVKLATAFVARSLVRFMQERSGEAQAEAPPGGSSVK